MAQKLLDTAAVAETLETDPRTLRRFLRSDASPLETVGKGKRYVMDAQTLKLVKKAFEAWSESKGNSVTKVKDIPSQRKSS